MKKIVLINRVQVWIAILAVVFFFGAVTIFTTEAFANDLVDPQALINHHNTGIVLYDLSGKPFYSFYDAREAEYTPLSKISTEAQHAVVASEDKDFYHHPGFSATSIIRSFVLDLRMHQAAYGGSTITQQLVKNTLLSSSKNIVRKYQEIVLANNLEEKYSKDQILEMYLNSVYFGRGAYGINNAAHTYFGKNPSDLDAAESAYLISLLPSPTTNSSTDPNIYKSRQKIVLDEMLKQKYITTDQEKSAENEELSFDLNETDMNNQSTQFALMVRQELVDRYGEDTVQNSGFKVYTTINPAWQKYAEETVKAQVKNLAHDNVSDAAVVVTDPKSGEVRAIVGSVDWNNNDFGKINMAITPRQVGSSFKPIIYAAGFESRVITPATVLKDQPTIFAGNYKPLDYDRKFRGTVLTRRALANSLNIPSVEVMSRVGLDGGLEMAKRLGITSLNDPSNYGLSLVLGTGDVKLTEMTNAYATFANQGNYNDLTTIQKIVDKYGNVIYEHKPNPQPTLDPSVAFLVTSILSDKSTRQEEFGSALDIPITAAVKTGTTEDYKDSLTLGYTPNLAIGVWVGNTDNKAMDNVAGSLGAAPIWKALMVKFSQDLPKEDFAIPAGVVAKYVCKSNGLLATQSVPSNDVYKEYFLSGTEPHSYCQTPKPAAPGQPQVTPPSVKVPQTITPPVQDAPEKNKAKTIPQGFTKNT